MRTKSNNGIKWMIYLLMASTVFGSSILTVKLAGLSLFPFRVIFVLVSYLFLLVFLFNRGGFDISHIKVRPYIKFLLFWILYAFFSFLWAKDRPSTIKDLIFLFTNISIILFVVYYFTNLKDFERFYSLWLLILLPLICLGFWNQLTGQQFVECKGPDYAIETFMHTPRAIFTNQNDYATYLALNIPFVITFIRYSKNNAIRFFGILILLACLYLIVFTFSRANYIAVLLGIIFWYLVLVRKAFTMIKILGVIFVLLTLFLTLSPSFVETISNIFYGEMTSLTQSDAAGSVNIRNNLIKNSFLFLLNSFGIGIGAGNSEYYMEHYSVYSTYGITNVHNWWGELLVEHGIFIFVAYLLFYLNIFVNLYKIYKRLSNIVEKKICESLLVGLVIFIFASISSSSVSNDITQWMLFAFCLGFLNYYRNRSVEYH